MRPASEYMVDVIYQKLWMEEITERDDVDLIKDIARAHYGVELSDTQAAVLFTDLCSATEWLDANDPLSENEAPRQPRPVPSLAAVARAAAAVKLLEED